MKEYNIKITFLYVISQEQHDDVLTDGYAPLVMVLKAEVKNTIIRFMLSLNALSFVQKTSKQFPCPSIFDQAVLINH